ncbi:hypothetical protein H6F76_15295 [Leptolyngbya sp. FACHB-321]|uniref:hypothetical protein n=1 Tax=Leptolyngbya sp. FACHB-321 TaxID=2692807 RepID=UPI0016888D1C|nr:hypothetical protein [Leptolyngbya sp. FACHB-321]MBD2036379.1 hypothetical protein [Leptolyngbya sp. FACHB-321]
MASPLDRPIIFELVVRSTHPAILEGLDVWLRLGLLSDETVRQLCEDHLTCLLSESVAVRSGDKTFAIANDFATEAVPEPVGASAAKERSPNVVARSIQSFMAEVSVIWLLFLGVFMVVVSSGVLAATQWRNFSPVAQYGLLFAYTLAFWAASVWTGRQPNLHLTARMLQVATLLIIPVNFWTMDGFRLWQSGLGWVAAAIAALVLTGITVQLLRAEVGSRGADSGLRVWLPLGVVIALSWLHWGWGWTGFPLVATYVGTIGATIALVYQERELGAGLRHKRSAERGQDSEPAAISDSSVSGSADSRESQTQEALESSNTPSPLHSSTPSSSPSLTLSTITIAIATLLLLGRAVFAAGVSIDRLGLAIGICGWLLCWLGRRDASRLSWQRGGTGLLLAGWLIAVTVTPPWQAIAISGLSLWLLGDRLWRSGQGQYLTAGWLVGLQAVWLLWRVISPDWQQRLIATSVRFAGSEAMPISLLGLWFFPYLVLTVWLAFRLRRWHQAALAQRAELLALILGVALAAVSFGNGLTRSCNLALSTLALISVLRGRTRPELPLVYLTHATGVAAIAALIHVCFPNLNLNTWAGLLLIGMVVEWGVSLILPSPPATRHSAPDTPSTVPQSLTAKQLWQQSTWHLGLVLSASSYLLLRNAFLTDGMTGGLMWLITPIALTVLGSRRGLAQQRLASGFSVVALFLVQVLLFDSAPERLIGLGTATVLLLINTHQLRQLAVAVVTVGFGLAFAAVAIYEALTDQLTIELSINLLAIAVLLLWLLWGWLQRRTTVLATLYRKATDRWAIAVAVGTLLLLTLCHLVIYGGLEEPDWQYLSVAVLLLVATGYRTWRQPQNASFYAIAWSLELVVTGSLALTGKALDAVAITNLALGLGTQLLGDWWLVRRGVPGAAIQRSAIDSQPSVASTPSSLDPSIPSPFSSWHIIPLLYALVGLLIQHRSFTATTGLFTLAAALVGIGVGRRKPFRLLVYLSLLFSSIAAYELLVYQLLQAEGGRAGDGIVLLAGLAAAIAIANRLLQRWLIPYLRLTAQEVAAIAHLHWGFGSALLPTAIASSLSASGAWLWISVTATLAAYALVMGNERWQGERGEERREYSIQSVREASVDEAGSPLHSFTPSPHHPSTPSLLTWTYAGIIEALAALAYLLHQLLPESVLLAWGGAIAAGVAFGLYQLPWQRWGWQREPWRRSMALLPVAVSLLTAGMATIQSLLIAAAFYAWLAKVTRQVRLSYLGVVLADWALLRWLNQIGATESLWYAAVFSASLLYLTQIDPALRSSNERERRHLLRSLAAALVCLTAFYQAEVGIAGAPLLLPGILSIAIALGFILAGLRLRIRAFLFVGTAVFMIQVLRQVARFASESLPLWSMGIVLGIAFIWIAATFEARRTQISTLMNYWSTELEAWD